jgi:hypothetical protein
MEEHEMNNIHERPIIASSLYDNSPGKDYVNDNVKMVPYQVTVHPVSLYLPNRREYDDTHLNERGRDLLQKCRTGEIKTKGLLHGKLELSRTGTMVHDDGAISLCSWENRRFTGTVSETNEESMKKYMVTETGSEKRRITTNNIILYEMDDDARKGWIYTVSGSFYNVTLE